MSAFRRCDRVVMVDGRCATVIAAGPGEAVVESFDGEFVGPMKDTDLSVAVEDNIERERVRNARRATPPPD